MDQTTKLYVAMTLALGTLISATVVGTVSPIHQEAQTATTPYHVYHGYIDHNANFIMDKHFINATKYDNVTFSDIKLAKMNTTKKVEEYDQTFKGIAAEKNETNQLQFIVKNNISLRDIQRTYGRDLKKENNRTKESDSGIFYYQHSKKSLGIWFVVDHNRVIEVTVGHTSYKTSK